ncbi:MAG: glycosyltransferase family 4 protein [Planctomycetaceae bacterium]|nr:glycosyltransferase family 4 protein [Planctomycetaceae bacterium]
MSSSPLTIVQVLPALNGGGVERGTVEVSRELVQRGHRSIVVSGGGKLAKEIEDHGGVHVTMSIGEKSPLTFRHVVNLRNLVLRDRVDVLHARSRVPAWVAWLCWKSLPKTNRPHFVTTAHGLYSVNRYSEIMTSGERVIAISETVRSYLHQNYPRLAADRVCVIPRGVDPQDFPRGYQPSAEWLERWFQQFPDLLGRPVITLVGRLTRCKGHHDLIEIVDRLRKTIPEIRAVVVGGVDPKRQQYAAEIQAQIERRGLADHIVLAGHRSDVREIYAVSSVVLALTSDPPEAFGRTTVESLSMGIPVVGYEHGGTAEILKNLFPNGLVPAGHVDAAAKAIETILAHGAPVPENTLYLKERMLAQTLAVYEEIAA